MNVFDLASQQDHLDDRLTVALEKVAEVFRVLQWNEAKTHGLSPIQMQILVFLATHELALRKPAHLASEFNMTRPTISDAVKSLEQKKLLTRKKDPKDTRSHFLELTANGQTTAQEVSHYPAPVQQSLSRLDEAGKSQLLVQLLNVINTLVDQGMIEPKRMCFTCQHYRGNQRDTHHCELLGRELKPAGVRIDCPEHALRTR